MYQSTFSGSFYTLLISIEVIDATHPEIDILQFHLDQVILNSATKGWFEKYWSDLSARPHYILEFVLPSSPRIITSTMLMNAIERYRDSKDREYISHTLASWAENTKLNLSLFSQASHNKMLILNVTIVQFVMIGLTCIYLVALQTFRKRLLNSCGSITTKDLTPLLVAYRHAQS